MNLNTPIIKTAANMNCVKNQIKNQLFYGFAEQ